MPGNKSVDRALSYTDPPTFIRLVDVADGTVDPADPPAAVPLIDNTKSVVAINEVFMWLMAEAGVTATVQLWAVLDDMWYFVAEDAIAVMGRSQVFHVANVPAQKYAIVVTALAGGNLTITDEHTA